VSFTAPSEQLWPFPFRLAAVTGDGDALLDDPMTRLTVLLITFVMDPPQSMQTSSSESARSNGTRTSRSPPQSAHRKS
jgi:hypothetical protein